MLLYWLWLSLMPGFSGKAKLALLRHFQTPEDIYAVDRRRLRDIPQITPAMGESLLNKDLTQARKIAAACEQKEMGILTFYDSMYPQGLRNIEDPPLVLYCKGTMPQLDMHPVIGVVGTRHASSYGLRIAAGISGQIAACGGIVTTGGAKGIDTCAMEGALAQGKKVVVFQAGGLDKLYPSTNRDLFDKVCRHGCILSEYPPGTACFPGNFLQRNRLISAVSDGVLVVEAPRKSGALNTARWASEQGKEIFVVPGAVDDVHCEGSNALLGDIARPALDGWMVMKEYQARYPHAVKQAQSKPVDIAQLKAETEKPKRQKPAADKIIVDKDKLCPYSVIEKDISAFDEQERAFLEKLSDQPVPVDTVLEHLPFSSKDALRVLTKLTVKGVVKSHAGNMISLK